MSYQAFIIICLTLTGTLSGSVNPLTSALDESDRTYLQKESPQTLKKIDQEQQLTIDDIKKMAHAGLSDDVIMNQIDETHSIFYLSSADIVDLQKSKISQEVINYMIQTGNQ